MLQDDKSNSPKTPSRERPTIQAADTKPRARPPLEERKPGGGKQLPNGVFLRKGPNQGAAVTRLLGE
jgi:hypothetical protein